MHAPHHTTGEPESIAGPVETSRSQYASLGRPNRVFSVRCAGFADARGSKLASDSLLVQTTGPRSRRVLAIGSADEVRTHPAWVNATHLDLPGKVVAPALVNAHTHLDLTHIGPQPFGDGGFSAWIDMVRSGRLVEDDAVAESTKQGVAMLHKGGTVAVGDIVGTVNGAPSLAPVRVLDEAGMLGTAFLEFFALSEDGSPGVDRAIERSAEFQPATIGLGLQPHAPYSASPRAYQRARERGLPMCTHLAESMAERQVVAEGTGPMRDMLAGWGLWTDGVAAMFRQGRSPVLHLADYLEGLLAVHLNDLGDADIELLAKAGSRVAYCPRSSAYFGADGDFGLHRYRDLLAAGVPVALGTDSIINLPQDSVDTRGICVLDEARLLLERDGTDPVVLLEMLYTHAPAAVGLGLEAFRIDAGSELAGLMAVESGDVDPSRGLVTSTGMISFL